MDSIAEAQEQYEECYKKEELHAIFIYCPSTGIIRNRINRGSRARIGKEAGTLKPDGYRQIQLYGVFIPTHRLAWILHHGAWPDGGIDHIDHNFSNNRIKNLRVVTPLENQRNRTKNRNNLSGITGVFWDKKIKKWRTQIGVEGKSIYLGHHDNLFLAYLSRRAAERTYGFHINHGKENHHG